MDNAISRRAAIDAVRKYAHYDDFDVSVVEEDVAIIALKDLPSVQPEIVRCKDCKYCEHWYADKGRCFLWHEGGIDVFEDGFCNYAERRTDETN